ncbi:MAG: copper chaperone PCu(A)C [Geodermatophilaceae bacterium]|nr:copper chaperone PCu(A)C [Geodermatophilaceae bacterium]
MGTERTGRVGAARVSVVVLAVAAISAAVLLGRSGQAADPLPAGAVSAGEISVDDAYVREPASPANAAAYFTIRNAGSDADELVRVTTAAAPTVSLHDLPGAPGHHAGGQLLIEPSSTVRLAPGHGHAMLEAPTAILAPGETVTLVLTFARAGELRALVPVLAIGTDPPGGRL